MKTCQLKWYEYLLLFIAAILLRLLGTTWRISEKGRKDLGPNSRPNPPVLFAFWHEAILPTAWHHRGCEVAVMISSSYDGELIAQLSNLLGYLPIRGSSSRGGREAAIKLITKLKEGRCCAITPDGPKGPRRQVQQGVSVIPRKSRRVVVPIAFAAEHCWRFKSWDQFMLPKPFSRCVFFYGEPVCIGPEGDSTLELERVQAELDRAFATAENTFKEQVDIKKLSPGLAFSNKHR